MNDNTENTELIAESGTQLAVIADLAEQAQYYSRRAASDMLQLGRVLTEAKKLIPHGAWKAWVDENTGLDIRGAEYFMGCYAKYGLNEEASKLGKSKLIALLPLEEGRAEKMIESGEAEKMSVREIKEAVKKAREEEQAKAREAVESIRQGNLIEMARQKENAEKAIADAMETARKEKETEIALQREQIAAQRAQIEAAQAEAEALRARVVEAENSARAATEAAVEGTRDITRRNAEAEQTARKLLQELEEKNALIEEMQEQYDQIQREYLNAQSALAKGDAERSNGDILSAEAVQDACRIFMGQVGRVPFMHGTFSTMDENERDGYRQSIEMVLDWAQKSLNTIETVSGNGGIIQ